MMIGVTGSQRQEIGYVEGNSEVVQILCTLESETFLIFQWNDKEVNGEVIKAGLGIQSKSRKSKLPGAPRPQIPESQLDSMMLGKFQTPL